MHLSSRHGGRGLHVEERRLTERDRRGDGSTSPSSPVRISRCRERPTRSPYKPSSPVSAFTCPVQSRVNLAPAPVSKQGSCLVRHNRQHLQTESSTGREPKRTGVVAASAASATGAGPSISTTVLAQRKIQLEPVRWNPRLV